MTMMKMLAGAACALILAPGLAQAADGGRQFDLHCTGKTDKGAAAEHWVSVDTAADFWCVRTVAKAACKVEPFLAQDDSLAATADDPDRHLGYSFSIARDTGAYDYSYSDPRRSIEDHGTCAAAPFTPYKGAPVRSGATDPVATGMRF